MNPIATDDDDAPGDAADEVLVAYLDGQLSHAECERVEAELATDPATRARLQSLDRVWNALDALPRPTASAAFTRTTVDMAALAAGPDATTVKTKRRPTAPWWLMRGVVGLGLGLLVAVTAITAPQRRALQELPVSLHASALEQVGTLSYLESVADGLGESLAPFLESTEDDASTWEQITGASPVERQAWVTQLTPAAAADFSARVAEHHERTEAKRASLAALADQIAASGRAEELRRVALAYEAMVARLPASDRATLRQRDEAERLRLVRGEAPRWAREAKLDLDDTERAAFRDAVDRLVASPEYTAFDQNLIEAIRDELERRGVDRFGGQLADWMEMRFKLEPTVLLTIATMQAAGRSDRWGPMEGLFAKAGRGAVGEDLRLALLEAWLGWVEQLQRDLPERVAAELANAPSEAELGKRMLLLLRQAGAQEDLPGAFARLEDQELDRMLLLPPEEFRDELSGRIDAGYGFPSGPPDGDRRGGMFGDRGGPGPGFGPPGGFRRPDGFGPPGGKGPPREPPPPRD